MEYHRLSDIATEEQMAERRELLVEKFWLNMDK
jgi:hypothetical protein